VGKVLAFLQRLYGRQLQEQLASAERGKRKWQPNQHNALVRYFRPLQRRGPSPTNQELSGLMDERLVFTLHSDSSFGVFAASVAGFPRATSASSSPGAY
jgi:hypothetical protein